MLHNIGHMRLRLWDLSVLDGLPPNLQSQLAALVVDFLSLHEMYWNYRLGVKWLKEDRQLLSKWDLRRLKKVTEVLEAVTKRLSGGELKRLKKLISKGRVKARPNHDPHPMASRLMRITAALRLLAQELENKLDFKVYKEWAQHHLPSTTDPKVDASKQFYWFFVSKCRLAKNEAQVRVAKISKDIFNKEVSYREQYEGEDRWKGSTTIRQRIKQGL